MKVKPGMDSALRERLRIETAAAVSGGCIHQCHVVVANGRRGFLKTNASELGDAFAAEADGLLALRNAGLRAPEPLAHGVAEDEAYLLLEYLELGADGDFAALGRMLAKAHRQAGPRFGWARDNSKTHKPQPSLLHGDLWSGNAAFTQEGPMVFDSAVYYGDREADLAMTELFGGFPREFYKAYNETFPLDAGYEMRKHLYNLYHLLDHLNLFGRGYLGQVKSCLRLLGL